MAWFLVKCHSLTYDGGSSFETGSFACSEGESVEERAAKWVLQKLDPSVGVPDLYYKEALTRDEISHRNLESISTFCYSIEPIDGPIEGAWVCGDGLLCTIPPGSR